MYLFSLYGRIPDIDDAWIGELAYWLAEEGQMRSELMRGITGQEEKFVVNNKLFTLLGAAFIKLFGFSVYTLKSVSLLWFVLFLVLFTRYTTKWTALFNRRDLVFAMLIIFSFTYLFKFSFLYRPEVMMMTLGLGGYIFLERYLKDEKTSDLIISGILLGLTCATHLNGLILVASSALLLTWNKKYLQLVWLGMATLVGFLPFFFDMTTADDYRLWYHQFFESPALDSIATGPSWLKPLYNLLREYVRYFYKIEVAVYSLLVIFTLVFGFSYLHKKYRNLLLFALFNIFFTGLIAMHKSQQYLLLNFPFILILIIKTCDHLGSKDAENKNNHTAWQSAVMAFLLSVFFVSSVYHNTLLLVQKFSASENRELALKYAGTNTDQMNIVAPMIFVFNEIENFHRIQGEPCYVELSKVDAAVYGSGVLEKAETFEIDVLMFTPFYAETLGVSGFEQDEVVSGYQLVDKTDQLMVFIRVQD
jgi:hypothetical protein